MYRLVLVEDDFQIRHGLSHFFPWQEIGFAMVATFENGKQALSWLRENPADVLLTDVRMPVMDGLALIDALHQENIAICSVILSAHRDFDYAQQAMALGVHHYIVKSTRYDDLVSVFRQLRSNLDAASEAATPLPLPAPLPSGAHDERVIRLVKQCVKDDPAHACLQTIAGQVNLSPVYLSRYFKEKTGVHFIDYIITKKMTYAVALLKQQDKRLAQIAQMVGYSNEKNFSRAFKKHFGISPNDYRKLV